MGFFEIHKACLKVVISLMLVLFTTRIFLKHVLIKPRQLLGLFSRIHCIFCFKFFNKTLLVPICGLDDDILVEMIS